MGGELPGCSEVSVFMFEGWELWLSFMENEGGAAVGGKCRCSGFSEACRLAFAMQFAEGAPGSTEETCFAVRLASYHVGAGGGSACRVIRGWSSLASLRVAPVGERDVGVPSVGVCLSNAQVCPFA